MVHSHLAYCINIYGCATKTNLEKLVLKQKQAIRTISRANYRDHTGPLFRQHKILPLHKMIEYYNVKFMHSYFHKKLPLSFAEIWQTNNERTPNRNLRNGNDYYVPPHRIELVKRMPICAFPASWNLTIQEKENPIQHKFLKSLKESLLSTIV